MFEIFEKHPMLDGIGSRKSRFDMRNKLRSNFAEVDEAEMTLLLGRLSAYQRCTSMIPDATKHPDIYRISNESLYGPLQVIYVMEF